MGFCLALQLSAAPPLPVPPVAVKEQAVQAVQA